MANINITHVESPRYSKADNSQIDCVITCDRGVLPFTVRPDDPEAYGRELWNNINAGIYGSIAPFSQ